MDSYIQILKHIFRNPTKIARKHNFKPAQKL